jgi:hypothetical protein
MNTNTPQTVDRKTCLERCPPNMPNKGCAEQGVCHTVALPFALKGILQQKKNYGNSNISPSKNIIFKISSKRNQILQDIITL